jgi:hypothetical protein
MDGALPLDRVLRTLFDHGVSVQRTEIHTARLEKGAVLEVALFTAVVPRWIINRLGRVFDIPTVDFYFPSGLSSDFTEDPEDDDGPVPPE